jgi:hypothetical protein
MGIRLVGAALNPAWTVLSDRARLVLLHMCYTARDTATDGCAAATYWGGQEVFIVTVLGIDPDALPAAEHATVSRKIKRAVQELKVAGAISLKSSASRGRNAIYEVHPDRFPTGLHLTRPVDNSVPPEPLPVEWGTPSTPLTDHPAPPNDTEWGSPRGRNGGHPAPPRGEHIGEQSRQGEIHQPTQPPTQLSRSAS